MKEAGREKVPTIRILIGAYLESGSEVDENSERNYREKPEAGTLLMKEFVVRQLIFWKLFLPYLDGRGKCGRVHSRQTFERGRVTFNARSSFIQRTGSFAVIVLRTKQLPEAV